MKKFIKNKRGAGFTLVETLFGVSIFILISLVLTLFARNIFFYNSFITLGLSGVEEGKNALKTIVAEIRTASSGSNGVYPISQATATSFIFYSDINNDGLKERVRYFLNGSLLQKGVVVPTGSPLDYNLASEVITTLVSNVTNASIFSYYNSSYAGTTSALSFPVDISVVRLVKITITTDKDPNRPPASRTFSTQVSLRNLKDNL